MKRSSKLTFPLLFAVYAVVPVAMHAQHAEHAHHGPQSQIEEAMKAAPMEIAHHATIMDWEQNVLREGTNGWTCMPTPPNLSGTAPMCFDEQWMNWAHAWMTKTTPNVTELGISYMLAGDEGASNSDPWGTEENSDDWVVSGPHLMIITPDPAMLDGMTADPSSGGPWVMWQGTPYAHIMVPVGEHK